MPCASRKLSAQQESAADGSTGHLLACLCVERSESALPHLHILLWQALVPGAVMRASAPTRASPQYAAAACFTLGWHACGRRLRPPQTQPRNVGV